MDEERSFQCFMCRSDCDFVISHDNAKGFTGTIWRCGKCNLNIVEIGDGSEVDIVMTDVCPMDVIQRFLADPFDLSSLSQRYTDNRIFICPSCNKKLEEIEGRRITLRRSLRKDTIPVVEIRMRLRCDNCHNAPRFFEVTYCRGTSQYSLVRI